MPPDPAQREALHSKQSFQDLAQLLRSVVDTSEGQTAHQLASNAVQVVPAKKLAIYRKLLPSVVDPEIQNVLEDPNTLIYDEAALPPAYQDDSVPVVGVRASTNHPDGAPFRDPKTGKVKIFSHGAGLLPGASNKTFHFLSLPKDAAGNLKKIRVWKTRNKVDLGDLWEWEFPEGTISGEVVYANDSSGASHVLEVRTRKTKKKGTLAESDIFVPAPTKTDLLTKLQEVAGNSDPSLAKEAKAVKKQLESPAKLFPVSVGGGTYTDSSLVSQGGSEQLPPMSEKLSKAILHTPFLSSRGAKWDSKGTLDAFAPTTAQAFGIVPQHSQRGAVGVDKESCAKCHEKANVPLRDLYFYDRLSPADSFRATLDQNTFLYGRTPGSGSRGNENLRWHPFNPKNFKNFGITGSGDNRSLRPEFKPIIEFSGTPDVY